MFGGGKGLFGFSGQAHMKCGPEHLKQETCICPLFRIFGPGLLNGGMDLRLLGLVQQRSLVCPTLEQCPHCGRLVKMFVFTELL
jgi:hypothetical protein